MSEMSILEMRRLLKERALEGNKASTTIRHQMAAAKAKYDAETDASKDRSKGTMAGAVGPFALDKGYDYLAGDEAAKEGLASLGPQNPNMAPPVSQRLPDGSTNYTGTGQEFNAVRGPSYDQAVPKSAITPTFDAAVGGGGSAATAAGGPGVGTLSASQVDKLIPVGNTLAGSGSTTVGLGGANSALGVTGAKAGTDALNTALTTNIGKEAVTGVVTPVAGAGAAAPAGALATGAAGLGAGLGGAAGAYGGKALAAEFTDDPTIQGVASVGGGALGGAAAGAAIGSAGGPIGAPIGAIIGAIGGLLGAF
jgi:hypothetical protein